MENGEIKTQKIEEQAPQEMTREQLEANVKVSETWLRALRAGTYPGMIVPEIAGLIGFLTNQNKLALADYEKASLKHPEWGTKPVAATVPGVMQ